MEPTTTPAFDPYDFADVESGELVLKDPTTGAPTGAKIQLAGPEHPDRKRRTFAKQRKLRLQLAKTGKVPVSDPEDEAADEVDELVACTLGWTGMQAAYSPAEARKLYSDPRLAWLRAQVRGALEERDLFIKRSARA